MVEEGRRTRMEDNGESNGDGIAKGASRKETGVADIASDVRRGPD
jgi:hypothetical protein